MLGRTLLDYELFIYALQDDHLSIQMSTLAVIHQASDVATVEANCFFVMTCVCGCWKLYALI